MNAGAKSGAAGGGGEIGVNDHEKEKGLITFPREFIYKPACSQKNQMREWMHEWLS